jgi:hypothetical protein
MAVRFVNYHNTNYVTEKLVVIDTVFGLGVLFTPDGPGGTAPISQKQSFYLETAREIGFSPEFEVGTNKYLRTGLKMVQIKNLPNPKDSGELSDWNFWPVPETNLWVAVNSGSNHYERNFLVGDKDVYLKVYLFNPKAVIRQKQLTVFVPEHNNNGYPDFRFDTPYQHITYKTRNGYETYNFLQDTIIPCEAPSGTPALPIKNRGEGFDAPFLIFFEGRHYLYHVKTDD